MESSPGRNQVPEWLGRAQPSFCQPGTPTKHYIKESAGVSIIQIFSHYDLRREASRTLLFLIPLSLLSQPTTQIHALVSQCLIPYFTSNGHHRARESPSPPPQDPLQTSSCLRVKIKYIKYNTQLRKRKYPHLHPKLRPFSLRFHPRPPF